MRIIAVLLLTLLAHSPAEAQTLWRDLPAGATLEQVRTAIPEAIEPNPPSVLADGRTKGLLEVTGFQLANLDFKATLYFKDQKLDRVFLNPVERISGQNGRAAARKLHDSLQAKYGAPLSADKPKSTLGKNHDAEWQRGGSLIKFSFTQYSDDGAAFLQLIYLSPRDEANL